MGQPHSLRYPLMGKPQTHIHTLMGQLLTQICYGAAPHPPLCNLWGSPRPIYSHIWGRPTTSPMQSVGQLLTHIRTLMGQPHNCSYAVYGTALYPHMHTYGAAPKSMGQPHSTTAPPCPTVPHSIIPPCPTSQPPLPHSITPSAPQHHPPLPHSILPLCPIASSSSAP